MRPAARRTWILAGAFGLSGIGAVGLAGCHVSRHEVTVDERGVHSGTDGDGSLLTASSAAPWGVAAGPHQTTPADPASVPTDQNVRLASHADSSAPAATVQRADGSVPAPMPLAASVPPAPAPAAGPPASSSAAPADALTLNLPTALSMVGGQHPAVGAARWRVREAYARLERTQVLWLPSIQPGFSLHRHDGNYQASNGEIVDVNRNSVQYGLGAGATGAGTTNTRPGLVAQFHVADAIFQPEIAEKTAWARQHAAAATVNDQLLEVAVAYLELLDATQDLRILEQTRDRTAEIAKLTADFAEAGEGLQADADRLETEVALLETRLAEAREGRGVASARLAQALSVPAGRPILPADPTVVPIELVPRDAALAGLIPTALSTRPELRESQALVAAACEAYRREKYAPLTPSVLLGFSTDQFGGGLGNDPDNFGGRYDMDAVVTWEVRNLGFGEAAARRETAARVEQAKFEQVRVMDRVAREVSEAHARVVHRAARIAAAQRAIRSAEDSYERNLSRIRDGQGLPLEALQSVQALDEARRAYLAAVIGHNEAQFRLQYALGWPVAAGATADAL